MHKADLLDELRAEIGTISDKCDGNLWKLYRSLCQILHEKVSIYQSVSIYFAKTSYFEVAFSAGNNPLPAHIPFGEGNLSIAAVRGGLVSERSNGITGIYVPFYQGHNLIGELVMTSKYNAQIDDEDFTLFCELASLLETKLKDCM